MDDQRPVAGDAALAGIERKIDALQLEMATLKAAIDNVPAEIGAAVPDISPTLQMLVVINSDDFGVAFADIQPNLDLFRRRASFLSSRIGCGRRQVAAVYYGGQ